MSKIPVAKKGFRSWLSTNEGKPSKSVLYEQKYQNHHDRIRNKENMSENDRQSSPMFVSMVNPQPTAEDYEKYDADRRLREKARDMRVAQRSASSSAGNSLSLTPEAKETSPSSDQYFTPKRGSDGLDDEFVTPSTSKKDRRKRESSGSQDVTPISSKPPRHRSRDEHAHYTTCLSRKMEDNFTRMQDFVFSGHTVKEARERAIAETTGGKVPSERIPRLSSRRSIEERTVIVDRSSSQPPPIETLNSFPRVSRTESPGPSRAYQAPVVRTSYVDTLVATNQMHIQYADRVVVSVEKQMTKLESMKNLAALSPVVKAANRRRMAADALRKLVETKEETDKKHAVVRDLKDRVAKITEVQLATHRLVSSRPFQGDPYNERLLRSLDGWISLPFHEFDVQTARELQSLHKKMLVTLQKFKNVASLHRNNSNRSFNTSRRSIAMRIFPSELSTAGSSSDSPRDRLHGQTCEAATQVTARLADVAMTQTSPRRVGVEPLDLSSLEKRHSSSQTTPPRPPTSVLTEDASQQTTTMVASSPNQSVNPSTFATLSMTTPTMVDIDDMLNNIQLNNESLETIEPFSYFKTDISYPPVSPAPSAESTPRSGRVSLDSESARRLSAGISHFLEKIKKENESFEKSDTQEAEVKQEHATDDTPPPPSIQVDSPSTVENSEASTENQSPPLNDEPEAELNIDEHDATQFEHEMEEQEEQRKLRESAVTPTPPRTLQQDSVTEEYSQMMSYIDPEDDEDETKKFVNSDEFERSLEDEGSISQGPNESADDSGFLLDSRPAPPLKSVFDNFPQPSNSDLRSDTPRISDHGNETTFGNLDMEEYCQNDFLNEIGPVMVRKAIEFQIELRGLDWVAAQDVWKPPSFEEIHMDFYDHFDYFDSYSILIWGAVVDLINVNYLKFGRKLTESEEQQFEKEALDMLQREYGPESKKKEWSKEVKMSKKLAGMMPYDLDYRYDVRRGIPDSDKQKYQWQQVQMSVISDRYPRKTLKDELDEVFNSEKEKLGQVIIAAELEQAFDPANESEKPESQNSVEYIVGVSDV